MTEHRDYVALEWVKGEIEETLKQAEQALEAYVESPEDGTRMRFCLTYIHQVHGTLQMVEFYGAALLAEEMEKVAQAILNNKVREVREAQEVLMQAILQLPGYLEHLQSGKDDIPVTLLPLLNDLRSACGESLLTETSLFSPNLLPLRSEGDYQFVSAGTAEKLGRLREAYKLGLLGVIRNQGLDKSYATLAKACVHLEQLCGEAPMARLWWIAGAVVEGMSNHTIEDSLTLKGLLRQLEKEIVRLISDGDAALNAPLPEELAKNLLYYIAKSKSDTPSVRSIKQVFGLNAALPEEQNQAFHGSYKSAMGSVVTALTEELANLKEQFDLFTRSSDYDFEKLSGLGTSFKQIADTLAVLGLGPQRKALLEQIDKINHWIETQQKPEQSELMNIASALLMLEVGLNNATTTSSKSESTSDIPVDALNTAQTAVVKECRNGLEQVKDAIIGYIASQWNVKEIDHVPELLKSVEGALAMVPQLAQASEILSQTRSIIQSRLLAEPPEQPTWDMMDSLADAVAGVDYYLERVAENSQEEGGSVLQVAAESIAAINGDLSDDEFIEDDTEFTPVDVETSEEIVDLDESISLEPVDLDIDSADFATLEEPTDVLDLPDESLDIDLPVLDEELDERGPEVSLDAPDVVELTEAAQDDQDLSFELPDEFSEEPSIPQLDVEEEAELESDPVLAELDAIDDGLDLELGLASDEDLASILEDGSLEDEPLDPPVDEALSDLEIEELTDYQSSEVLETTDESALSASVSVPVPIMSEPVASDSDDMIDDEIIEIFIEEAEEVQETIAEFLPAYKANYEDSDAQTEVRRAFHTLKGSGRLVGAEQVGELAWKVENMLNRVIDQTIQASPDMFDLIDDVCGVFPSLVAAFAKGQPSGVDTQPLMDAADALVEGKPYRSGDALASLTESPDESLSKEEIELDAVQDSSLPIEEVEESEELPELNEEVPELSDELMEVTEALELPEEAIDVLESSNNEPELDELDQFTELDDSGDVLDSFDLAPDDIAAQLSESLSLSDVSDAHDRVEDAQTAYEIQFDGDETSDLLDIFKGEALSHLDVLDGYTQENLYKDSAVITDDVQRALHTLKGSAHMASVTPIAEFASICERVVKEVRAAHLMADQQFISQLQEAAGWIRDAVGRIDGQGHVELSVDPEWVESFSTAFSRLPSEMATKDDSASAAQTEGTPDHQMRNIFLMEGMDILGDIELIIRQWRDTPLNTQLAEDLAAEFDTLAKAARMARLIPFADMSDALERFVNEVMSLDGVPNGTFFSILDSGYESLVSLMDLLAAGQAITSTEDQITRLSSVDKTTLVDPLEEIELAALSDLEDFPEEQEQSEEQTFDALDEIALEDSVASESSEFEESLDEVALADGNDEFGLEDLASDDDLAALVDEFDEFGGASTQPEQNAAVIVPDFDVDHEDDDSELVSIFLEEADDIVSHLDENLQQWRSQLDNPEPVQELQRAIHTLKGGARLAEIKAIGDLCHELENLYEGLSEGKLTYNDALLDLLQDCHDAIATQVSDIHENKEPSCYPELEQRIIAAMNSELPVVEQTFVEPEEVTEASSEQPNQEITQAVPQPLSSNVDPELVEIFLEEAEELLDSITEHLEQWADQQDDLAPVSELQRELHTLKGGARMAELAPIGDLGHELENLYEGLVNGQFSSSDELIELLRACHDRLTDMTDAVQSQQMPCEANDLIAAITDYCSTGSYDASVLNYSAAPQAAPAASLELEASVQESEPDVLETDHVETDFVETEAQESETAEPELAEFETAFEPEVMAVSDIEEVDDEVHDLEELPEPSVEETDGFETLDDIALPESSENASLEHNITNQDFPELEEVDFDQADFEDAINELALGGGASDVGETTESDHDEADFDLSDLGLSALDAAAMEVSDIFLEEAAELSEQLDNACHAWTQDPESREPKAEVLRVLHTLKGGAKLAKLEPMAHATHDLETHIEHYTGDLDEAFFTDLVERIDQLGQLIEGSTAATDQDEAAVDALDALVEPSLASDNEAPIPELPSFELSDDDLLEEISTLDDSDEAPDELILGHEVEIEKIPAPEFGPSIREALLDQNAKGGQEAVKVSAELLENLVNLAGETSITRGRLETEITDIGFTLEDMDMTVSRLREQLKRLDIETQAQISYRTEMQQSHEYDDFDPLEMDRYTNMQQLSRALLESVTDILDLRTTLENKVKDSETLLLQQSRINTELQEGLMKSRMVPFSRLVPRLRRIVRQVAQELGKQVDFKVHNAEGEMDRTVMERMVAPLEHMLRNAVDHGVELPDARTKAGKKAKGTIELSVSREGGDVVLRLKDDGGGVNLEAVRNKAIERNLMKPQADLTDYEIMQFIFSPGFSTAQKVTQISGRGVGMDVVNSEIKQLGGNIAIDSIYGSGSEFEIRLPFTVSVNRALMVKVGDDLYAVPLNTIEGIVRVSPYELEEFYKEGSNLPYVYAGKEYRMEYMGTLLQSGHTPKLQGQVLPLPVLLVRGAEHPIALQVDSLMGSREVVVKSLGAQFSTVDGVSGATILGDGSVVIILDLAALIRAEHVRYIEQSTQGTTTRKEVPVTDRPLKVMVVDDSVTVRKVTTRVLQRQGYDVSTAKDGVDAIAKLQDERPDIMLLDIEMPRMDGFEVASHVRHNEQIKDLPIIMITSRTGDKHRDRAMSIGVNHYMGKPFQEAALLETIELLVGK